MSIDRGGVSRRQLIVGGGAALLAAQMPLPGLRQIARASSRPIHIADMHFHLFFEGRRPAHTQPLAANMARGNATLVSWSVVGDQRWLQITGRGIVPKGRPRPGQAIAWLREEMARVKGHLSRQGLRIALGPQDVRRAAEGEPHVVLSVEGATFADDGVDQVLAAYQMGVRHIQLVHFIANRIGDMQTEAAVFGGLSAYGREVVETCNKLGVLIDLAHCTDRAVEQVLEVSKQPVVWSHSSLQGWRSVLPFAPTFARRQLSVSVASDIAKRGGVIGLWALGADVGTTVESYTDRILDLASQLGDEHVAFGTDMNALSRPAIRNFADLRAVVDLMLKRGMPEEKVRNIAFNNYARVLTAAMNGRTS